MAITATFISATKEDSAWGVVISYSNGVKTILKSYNVTAIDDAVIKSLARSEIAGLKRVADSVGKLTITAGSLIDLTVAPAAEPTAAQIAESQWHSDYAKLARATELVSLGIIPASNAAYVALASKVKAGFLPGYL